nr:phosphate transport system ATP-binding protein [uncultured Gammaproteobacteria bacterium]
MQVIGLHLTLSGRQVLNGVSFTLPTTGITCLIGPSGAGKSTLLRCLNRLYDNWRGEVLVGGVSTRNWPGGVEALRRHLGLIGQKPVVFPGSIHTNLLFGLARRARKRTGLAETRQVLEQVALWAEVQDRLEAPAAELSLGQQQRLGIARALVLKPAILMLDEPTASLDPRARRRRSLTPGAGRQAAAVMGHPRPGSGPAACAANRVPVRGAGDRKRARGGVLHPPIAGRVARIPQMGGLPLRPVI